ncbi:ABC transporter ATP-binding protein [Candidatus Gottesmanbacteria bacterium]|nr:ABC transporter ATP-binding protein [Candidatus Gottesmanbacteria bacterium]
MKAMLEVNHLTKQFGPFTAVNDVSFAIAEGEIVGLLGPNGAGKTTTIQMLLGLITPTSGTISYFGRDFFRETEYCLSYINFASLYTHLQIRMTVAENLRIYALLYGVKNPDSRIAELLDLLEITQVKDQLYWHLSSGQKTRVNLAKSLLNKPRLLLMDEPTASLDPEIAQKVLVTIEQLQKHDNVSILYTSHNMGEVERLCDRVIFLDHGKIMTEDTPLGLTKRVGKSTLILTFDAPKKTVESYLVEGKYAFAFVRPETVEIKLSDRDIPKVLFGLSNKDVWITDIDIEKPDLEDVFLSIAGGTYGGVA